MHILFYDENMLLEQDLSWQTSVFLHTHLESYGDPQDQIQKAIFYALQKSDTAGGFVAVAYKEKEIVGAAVLNRTGMEAYIPENILVYIAIHRDYRGAGFGRKLMTECINRAKGDIALHVEPDNPALFLYESLNFTRKYIEMRFIRKKGD